MFAIAGIVMTAVIIAMLEAPSLWRKREMKELCIMSTLLLFGTGIAIVQSMHIPLPNPLDWIGYVYRPIGKLIDSALSTQELTR